MDHKTSLAWLLRRSRQRMLAVAILIVGVCQEADAECSKVTISDTMWQTTREGTYSKTSDQCLERNVYKQKHGDNYLYFIESNGGWRGWMVGTNQCANSGGIAVQDEAQYPEEVTSIWEEVYNGNWYYSYQLQTKCYYLSSAIVAGIVIGCLLFLAIAITVVVCCCKGKKRSSAARVSQAPTVAYTNTSVTTYNGPNDCMSSVPGYYPTPRGGYYLGLPSYGVPLVHAYGPPPAYTAATQQGAATPTAPSTLTSRPPSSPPGYTVQDQAVAVSGQSTDYPTKVST